MHEREELCPALGATETARAFYSSVGESLQQRGDEAGSFGRTLYIVRYTERRLRAWGSDSSLAG